MIIIFTVSLNNLGSLKKSYNNYKGNNLNSQVFSEQLAKLYSSPESGAKNLYKVSGGMSSEDASTILSEAYNLDENTAKNLYSKINKTTFNKLNSGFSNILNGFQAFTPKNLKKVKEISNGLSGLKSSTTTKRDISNMLSGFDDVNEAAQILNRANFKTNYNDQELAEILEHQYSSQYNKNQLKDIIANNKSTGASLGFSSVISSYGNSLKGVKDTLVEGASNIGTGIASTLTSMLPMAIISGITTAAIAGGKFLYDNVITNNAATKKYNTAAEEASTAESDYESAKSEYESNKERITELKIKQNRTLSESQELSQLEQQNTVLKGQVNTKASIADAAQKNEALNAYQLLNKKSNKTDYNALANDSRTFSTDALVSYSSYQTDLQNAKSLMNYIQSLEKELEDKAAEYGESPTKKQSKVLSNYQNNITTLKGTLSDKISTISTAYNSLFDDEGNIIDESYQDTATDVGNLLNDYAQFTDASNIETKLSNIFAKSDFSAILSSLKTIGKNNGSKAVEKAISNDDGLSEELTQHSIDTDDAVNYIMSLADPDAKNAKEIKNALKDQFDYLGGASASVTPYDQFVEGKTDTQLETFYNYLQDNNFDPEEYEWDLSDWNEQYKAAIKAAKEAGTLIDTGEKTFSSLFNNSKNETATDIDTLTDNLQTNLSNIKSSFDSLKSGEMQNSDVADLIQQFPELANETDNLQEGLQKLSLDKASEAIGSIKDSVSDVTDTQELAKAQNYIKSIMDNFDTSNYDWNTTNVKDQLTKSIKENSTGLMSALDASSFAEKLTSKYANDNVGLQALVKLSLDPSMANAGIEEWTSKVEELRPQIQLDISEKNLEELSNSLTRLQTEASNKQTEISNKSVYNQKATASDYKSLIVNGNEQITNLESQIEEYNNSIQALRDSNLYLDNEDNEQIRSYQDQIISAQASIDAIKVSQAEWNETIQNLPITDATNLASALNTAISETVSDTGLSSDSIKDLRTQFSDLTKNGKSVESLFNRTAKGVELNTARFKELSEAQNELVLQDYASKIAEQQQKAYDSNGNLVDSSAKEKLEELKNLQAEYLAQYKSIQSQLDDYQIMQNAKSVANAGDRYTQAITDLASLKEAYDSGEVGTEFFKKGAAYFSANGFEDAENFIENYNKWSPYYTEDSSGQLKFLDLMQSKGLATYKTLADGSQEWQMTFTDAAEAAQTLGMGEQQFKDYMGRYEDLGGILTNISSVAEGQQNVTDKTNELIEAQEKYSKLVAEGASQEALDTQKQVVEDLKSQVTDANTALDTYVQGTADRQAKSLKTAKQQINDLANEYNKVKDDSSQREYAEGLYDRIQEIAKDSGLELEADLSVNEDTYNQLLHQLGIGTLDSPLTATEMGYKEGSEEAKSYTNSLQQLTAAHDANSAATEADFEALSSYTASDLAGITLGDSTYNVDNLHEAEDALQSLVELTGLTKEELIDGLQGLGVIKPEVDDSDLEQASQTAQETAESLKELQDSGVISPEVDLDTDISDKTTSELQSEKQSLEETKAQLEVEPEVDESKLSAIESAIEARDIQLKIREAIEPSDGSTGYTIEELQNMTDEEIVQKIGVDSDTASIEEFRAQVDELSEDEVTVPMEVKLESDQFDSLVSALGGEKVDIPVTGQITSVENGTQGQSLLVDATANVTGTQGVDGQQVSIDATANVTETQGADGQNVTVDATANVTNIEGTTEKSVTVNADANGTDQVTGLNDAVNSVPPSKTSKVNAVVHGKINVDNLKRSIDNVNNKSVSVGATTFGTIAISNLQSAINGLQGKTVYIDVVKRVSGSGSGSEGIKFTGTATSIAHADGTAYNTISRSPVRSAYANGDIALHKNEIALVNEIGTESLVRDGKWSLLPGGAHFQSLKKGDIIFNAEQTKDLLTHGKISGHARALAQGTLSTNAYASSTMGLSNFRTKKTTTTTSTKTSSSNTNKSGSGSSGNTGSSNTGNTGNSSTAASNWEDVWKNIIDWFERLVEKFENRIDLQQAKAENTYSITSQNKYLDSAIKDQETLLKKYAQGRAMYVKQSDVYASKIGLSSGLKKKVQDGTVKLENLSEKNKKKVEAYQKWYDKIVECDKAIEQLKADEKDLYQQKLDNVTDRYDSLISVYSAYESKLEALNDARAEVGGSAKPNASIWKTVETLYTNSQKIEKQLFNEIEAYKTQYNSVVKKYGANSTIAQNAKAQLNELRASYYDQIKTTQEYYNQLREMRLNYDQWQVDRYDYASDRLKNYREYKEANNYKNSGNDINESDYIYAININDKKLKALKQQRADVVDQMSNYDVSSDKYQDLLKTLNEIDGDILDATNSTAEFKKAIVDVRFEPFEDAQEELQDYIDNLQDLRDMMDSDTFLDNDGSFTSQGLANIVLLNKEMEANKQSIADYKQHLADIEELYNNNMLTAEQYEEETKNAIDSINDAAKSLYNNQQEILEAYEERISKINDALQENIDKRKEALSAEKDYYTYNNTLKNKNKDIETLKAQIAALEGTTNASAKARLAELKASLQEKESDLADTKYEHQIEVQTKGYETLADKSDDTLDDTLQAVRSNSELQQQIINNMLTEVQDSYSTAYEKIQDIIEQTGYKTTKTFDSIIEKAKLTSQEVKNITASESSKVDTSGIDDQRTDKNQADEATNNAINASDTNTDASKTYGNTKGTSIVTSVETKEKEYEAEQKKKAEAAAKKKKEQEAAAKKKQQEIKKKLQAWYKKIPAYKNQTSMAGHAELLTYFWKKKKYVRSADAVQAAKILGTSYKNTAYSKWTTANKNDLLKKLKSYGFSKGGVVRSLIPANTDSLIGNAIIKNGDTGFIGARTGETVLTEEFTKQLKPTVAAMNAFTETMSGNGIIPTISGNVENNVSFNPEITVNVDSISSDVDIKTLGDQLSGYMYDKFTKQMRKDLSKSTGRNR